VRTHFDGVGDVVVITGGANGLGAALAYACAATGATTVVCDLDDKAGRLLAQQSPRLYFRHLDVADRDAVIRTVRSIEAEHGRIDGLVCAAAIQPRFAVKSSDRDVWERTLRINLDGVLWCYQAVVPGMVDRRRGSVIAFATGLAHSGWPEASAYASAEAALIAFVRSAARAVTRHGVRVNLMVSGVLDTPEYRTARERGGYLPWRTTAGVAQVDDLVGPVLFLLSEAATLTASVLSRDLAYAPRSDAG
jgi:3-oxoacyl-[acyl-carrier protein] reductase